MLGGWIGVVLAGCINGSFAVPSRGVRVMPWNGVWLVYVTVAKLAIPCLLGLALAAPIFSRVFPDHLELLGVVFFTGLMFGCGSFLFGASVQRLGIALSNAIVSGMLALVGSLGALFTGGAKLSTDSLLLLLGGLLIMSAGLAASCTASLLRDRSRAPETAARTSGSLVGVLLALVAGCFSSMLNVGFVYGKPLEKFAEEEGVQPAFSSLAIWVPILLGGFLVNVIATNVRLVRAGEYSRVVESPPGDWLRGAAMGILWTSAILIYGYCSQILGSTGAVYGWAIIVGSSIMTSNVWGIWLGEWTGASARAKAWLYVSLLLILASLAVLSVREVGS